MASPEGAGCNEHVLAVNDDGSTGFVALPWSINFLGAVYDGLYVNNNGNVTFDEPMSTYTPFTIDANTPPIIAPFLADVDTRGAGSQAVTYGVTDFGGRPAFCVEWEQVGYYSYHDDKLNDVQLLIVDQSPRAEGDFDIYFNYRTVLWETGDASGGTDGFGGTSAAAGYSAGTGAAGSFFQMACSLNNGACLDSNADTGLAQTSTNSLTRGRHLFRIESGGFVHSGQVEGTVRHGANGPTVADALVQACVQSRCRSDLTDSNGFYDIANLPDETYIVTVWPPGELNPASAEVTVTDGGTSVADFVVTGPTPPPAGTSVNGSQEGQIPTTIVGQSTTMTAAAVEDCAPPTFQILSNGVVREFIQDNQTVTTGTMTLVDGQWTAEFIVEFTGPAEIVVSESAEGCGGDYSFSMYIDPSGYVRTTNGDPIAGATVTLFRGDTADGPFTQVPDGSVVMDPSNRSNPDITDSTGHFGWNVAAGYYFVRATADGCVNPQDPTQAHRDTQVYQIPPPVTDIDLRLDCGDASPPQAPPTADAGGPYMVNEGGSVTLSGSATDPNGDALAVSWTVETDSSWDTGATCSLTDENTLSPTLSCTDDGSATVQLTVSDGINDPVSDSATVTVRNVAPTVAIASPGEGATFATGSPVTVAASFTDPASNDTHSCVLDWGDGTTADAGTITGSDCTASHTYADVGAYDIEVSVSDDDGGTGTDTVRILVTDEESRKVTGGGWTSHEDDRANFGFVVQRSSAGALSGQLQLRLAGEKIRFHGDTVDSLDVAGNTATWTGSGRYQGREGYTFEAHVEDNRNGGGPRAHRGSPDRITITVRDANGSAVISVSGDLQGGNVTVH